MMKLVVLVLLLIPSLAIDKAAATATNSRAIDDKVATATIKKYLSRYAPRSHDQTATCTLSASGEGCGLESLAGSTLVYPNSKSSGAQCIFGDPFGFQVVPGSKSKLLFYFQGGGACWDKLSTEGGLCTTTAVPNSPIGVFDKTNPANPFADYTIIHALYCSGDVWAGNVTQSYTARGHKVTQVGINNALTTIEYLKRQFSTGALAPTLDSFVIMGCSAGSIGTQLWADTLLSTFPQYKAAAVVPDSYAGIFPPDTMGPIMKSYRLCWSSVPGLLPTNLQESCEAGQLTLQAIEVEKIKSTKVSVSFIQSKIDDVQMSFYVAVGVSMGSSEKTITPTQFYDDVNAVFGQYNKEKNFLTFLVDGPQHCFTDTDVLYTTTPLGPHSEGEGSTEPSLPAWLAKFPVTQGGEAETECEGTVEPTGSALRAGENTYCSASLVPKTFEG